MLLLMRREGTRAESGDFPGLCASIGSFDPNFVAGLEFIVEVPLGGHPHGLVDGVVYRLGVEHDRALGVHLDVHEVAARLAVVVGGSGVSIVRSSWPEWACC